MVLSRSNMKHTPDVIGNREYRDSLEWRTPPCMAACPASTNARRYIEHLTHGEALKAFEEASRTNPFAASCGRICTRPCETACRRGEVDEPIQIAYLKRLAGDQLDTKTKQRLFLSRKSGEKKDQKVAIIGAGPSGLTCARDLALAGYKVDVFEGSSEAGGMIYTAVPRYRLPKEVVDTEVAAVAETGVKIKYRTKVETRSMEMGEVLCVSFDTIKKDYDAVYIAVGNKASQHLDIEGEHIEGVYHGIDLLTRANAGRKLQLGKHVVVIGGGDVAMDAARTSLRMPGTETVTVLYRRTADEMPASPAEYAEAVEEGINFEFLVSPVAFIGRDGVLASVTCQRMELSEPDESGRRRPVPIDGGEISIEADSAVVAIGQNPELAFVLGHNLALKRNGKLDVSLLVGAGPEGIFAGGDVVEGKEILIKAVADGGRTARCISAYLEGRPAPELEELVPAGPLPEHVRASVQKKDRAKMPLRPVEERIHDMDEVELGFEVLPGTRESMRCMNCGAGAKVIESRCVGCLTCVRVCPYGVPKMQGVTAKIEDDCQSCGICVNECPVQAVYLPYYDDNGIAEQVVAGCARPAFKASPKKYVIFSCLYGSSTPGSAGDIPMPDNVVNVGVWCTGKLTTKLLMLPLELGADHVVVAACIPGGMCRNHDGGRWAEKRCKAVKEMVDAMGNGQGASEAASDSAGAPTRMLFKYVMSPSEFAELIPKLDELVAPQVEAETK